MLISSDGAKQESNAYRLPTCHPPAHHSNATKDIPRPSHHSGRCIKERSWWMWQRRTAASAGKAAGQYYSTPLLEAAGSSTGRSIISTAAGVFWGQEFILYATGRPSKPYIVLTNRSICSSNRSSATVIEAISSAAPRRPRKLLKARLWTHLVELPRTTPFHPRRLQRHQFSRAQLTIRPPASSSR